MRSLRSQLASDGKLICGLSWISRNAEVGAEKSLSLQGLESILALPGIEFVNLQYGDTDAEQAALQARSGLRLRNVPEVDNFSDIDGLAALIEACDLVVTVSNMTAHLAGALGKRALVMLPFSVGLLWCWHLDREDSPWYPRARLRRQSSPGDWESVLKRLRAELTRSE